MNLYEIKNTKFKTKQVAAMNMSAALDKYHKYLEEHVSDEYHRNDIFGNIASCTYISPYKESDTII